MLTWSRERADERERTVALKPQLVQRKPRTLRNAQQWQRIVTIASLAMCVMVVVIMREQDRTIGAQRVLIQQLFRDSLELNRLRIQQIQQDLAKKEKDRSKSTDAPKGTMPGCEPHADCG
jgi:hypothetical protein